MNICIVLAAYNGAKYFQEQINSIRGQTFKGWRLLIRDDGSTDGTRSIVQEFRKKDKRVQLVEDTLGNQGSTGNFALLLQHAYSAGADYVFLCDQDDVWLPNKISDQLRLMQKTEQAKGANTPILIHSDLIVADRELNTIHKSFMTYEKIRHEERFPLKTLLVQNFVTGCTSLINRPLLFLSVPVPRGVIMHDWWIALLAAATGKISYLAQPSILYRQHEANELGAEAFWARVKPLDMSARRRWVRGSETLIRSVIQANELRRRLEEHITDVNTDVMTVVAEYCRLFENNAGSVYRLGRILRMGIKRQNLVSNLSLLSHVLTFQQDLYKSISGTTTSNY